MWNFARCVLSIVEYVWYRCVVAQSADSQLKGCAFESCTCHDESTIVEEGNGQPPHKVHAPLKNMPI